MNGKPAQKRHMHLWILAILMTILFGCANTVVVRVPPRMELKPYNTIGIVEFAATGQDAPQRDMTQAFMEYLQAGQPGVRIVELGPQDQLLRSMGLKDLDLAAIKAIGEKYNVDAVMTGHLEVSEVKPNIQLTSLTSVSAQAYVNAAVSTKLRESKTGATAWSSSAHGKWNLANVNASAKGPVNFGMSDRQNKYRKMVNDLARVVTADLRPTFEKRKVEK